MPPLQDSVSGAGVLLVDTEAREVVLVQDHTDLYNDCGGQMQRKSLFNCGTSSIAAACASRQSAASASASTGRDRLVLETAANELKEETRGIVSVPTSILQRCDHVTLAHRPGRCYRSYILHLPFSQGLCQAFSKTNVSMLPECYQESSDLARFPIQQFVDALAARPDGSNDDGSALIRSARTSDGRLVPLHTRGARVIAAALAQGLLIPGHGGSQTSV